ncbi:MAG: PQQ-binding-like beta-propeller repeat protein [Bacteroidales bacterium]
MKKNSLLIEIAIIFLVSSANIYAQDWSQFRGPGRDGNVTGFKAPASWPGQLTQIWKIKVGTGDASPVLVGKNIFLNTRQEDNEMILCLDAATGKDIWADKYPVAAATGPAAAHPGPRSTPAFADGKIVTFGISGILSCLDAATGKVIWRKDNPTNAIPQFYTGMSPLIIDDMCIAQVGTKDNGSVIALDLKTGDEKWKYSGEGPAYASPSVMVVNKKKLLILFTEKSLMALTLGDGKLQWQIAAPPQQRFYNCVSPCINGNIIYYTGQGTGIKTVEVVKEGSGFKTKDLWSNPAVGAKWNTPVLKDGYLYGFTDQRRIYCINATTGETAWIDNATNSDFATLVDCGSVLIGLPSTGNLIVFKPDSKAYSEVVKYKVSETQVYAFPVIAGNMVYVKDAESLTLYRIE